MIFRPLQGPEEGIYWYVLQTYNAAEVVFNRYWKMLRHSPQLLDGKPNESERRVQLINGIQIFFKSGANPEDLRGETLHGVIMDEMRQQDPGTWPRIIRPMLGRFKAWADIYSTPNGFDHFYDLYQEAKLSDEWGTFHSPSTEAWWWTAEEIASAKATMSEAEFAQEILAEFRDITSGKAYTAYTEALNDSIDSPFNPGHLYAPFLPVYLFCDFNLSPMCWVLAQHHDNRIHAFDEIIIENIESQYEAVDELCERLTIYGIKPNDSGGVRIIGDATGRSTQRTSISSDYDVLEEGLRRKGIRFRNQTAMANPRVDDRVKVVNARLKDASGVARVTINPEKCKWLKKDFQRVVWKPNISNPALNSGPDGKLGHVSDAFGYGVFVLMPLGGHREVGRVRVIAR